MVGRDKSRTHWKVLKIDRLEPSELNICEDPTTYSERECSDLLRRIHEGNKATGGLKFVTTCYGIVGKWIAALFCSMQVMAVSPDHFSFLVYIRIYKISRALLPATNYKKEANWCNLWSQCVCHLQM